MKRDYLTHISFVFLMIVSVIASSCTPQEVEEQLLSNQSQSRTQALSDLNSPSCMGSNGEITCVINQEEELNCYDNDGEFLDEISLLDLNGEGIIIECDDIDDDSQDDDIDPDGDSSDDDSDDSDQASCSEGGNSAVVIQNGNNNSTVINQSGGCNSATVNQSGDSNDAEIDQDGGSNQVDVTQTGENNSASVTVGGDAQVSITQVGDNYSSSVSINGGNFSCTAINNQITCYDNISGDIVQNQMLANMVIILSN